MTVSLRMPVSWSSTAVRVAEISATFWVIKGLSTGVPYLASSIGYAAVLAAVFLTWWRVEGTLSVHATTTWRRELFSWAAVAATFATGTAVGDMTARTLHPGCAGSIVLFAVAICVPAIGYLWWHWNPVASFWVAYVLTRPLGASVADWTGKGADVGGLGWGGGPMALAFAQAIAALVVRLSRRAAADQPLCTAVTTSSNASTASTVSAIERWAGR